MQLIIIFFILLIIIVAIIFQYNQLIKLKTQVKQSKGTIDVYLQQRFDLIPNLVQVVKGYANFEASTFENITKLRSQYNQTKKIEISEKLNNSINTILLTAEQYPNLKADEQFSYLQKMLTKIENELQAARRLYNLSVTKYNTKINTIPFNIVAKVFNFKKEPLFEIEAESTKNINIKF